MHNLTIAQYLVMRLNELGIKDIFGLPGDFNFNILEAIEKNKNTRWIGSTNELNAGYAADGYARENGYGAVVTTFGVGELSAINAIAGSYAENVPIVKIAGVPSTYFRDDKIMMHHTLGNGDFDVFQRIFSEVTAANAYLTGENAVDEIERVLEVLMKEKRPVYIALPVDVCNMPALPPKKKAEPPVSDVKTLKNLVKKLAEFINKAKKPLIVADSLVLRFDASSEMKELAEKTNFPYTTLLMGKGIFNEQHPNFVGTLVGKNGNPKTLEMFENSDCVIAVGTILSNINSSKFTIQLKDETTIDIKGNHVKFQEKIYKNILMKDILSELTKVLTPKTFKLPELKTEFPLRNINENDDLTYDGFFSKIQEFLKESDSVFGDVGCIPPGFSPTLLPNGCLFTSQLLWGSIGWATPAVFGACVADPDRRHILITGEGAHQLTVQEISNFSRFEKKPIIFVVNNDGYTIERVLWKNPLDDFNDIVQWDYETIPKAFCTDFYYAKVKTYKDLDKVMKKASKEQKNKLCYIEICLDKMDYPKFLKTFGAASRKETSAKIETTKKSKKELSCC